MNINELWEDAKDAAKEVVSGAAGAGVPVAAVALAGEAGVSAVGITTGLAALGMGTMLGGVAVVGLLGVGSYYGTKKLIEFLGDDE